MSVVYVVAGSLALLALLATFLFAMRGAERAVARALDLPPLRWFEVARDAPPAWKTFLVRLAGTLVPFGICATIFFVVSVGRGLPAAATTVVDVLPNGAAHQAGMQSGDRVLAIGDVSVSTWDELRAQVAKRSEPVAIALERGGQRQVLSVAPRQGRIGVTPTVQMREAGLAEALKLALMLPLRVVGDSIKTLIARNETKELMGPVGIVNETGKAANNGYYDLLNLLGILGSYMWPFIAATHAFDIATGWLFRLTFSDSLLPLPAVQIARLRLALYLSLGCWLTMLAAHLAATFTELPGTVPLTVFVTPGVWAIWPVLWVSARHLGKGSPAGVVLPVIVIPYAAPVMAIWVAQQLGQEEQRLRSHAPTPSG